VYLRDTVKQKVTMHQYHSLTKETSSVVAQFTTSVSWQSSTEILFYFSDACVYSLLWRGFQS